jgi:hypothetical protein
MEMMQLLKSAKDFGSSGFRVDKICEKRARDRKRTRAKCGYSQLLY